MEEIAVVLVRGHFENRVWVDAEEISETNLSEIEKIFERNQGNLDIAPAEVKELVNSQLGAKPTGLWYTTAARGRKYDVNIRTYRLMGLFIQKVKKGDTNEMLCETSMHAYASALSGSRFESSEMSTPPAKKQKQKNDNKEKLLDNFDKNLLACRQADVGGKGNTSDAIDTCVHPPTQKLLNKQINNSFHEGVIKVAIRPKKISEQSKI